MRLGGRENEREVRVGDNVGVKLSPDLEARFVSGAELGGAYAHCIFHVWRCRAAGGNFVTVCSKVDFLLCLAIAAFSMREWAEHFARRSSSLMGDGMGTAFGIAILKRPASVDVDVFNEYEGGAVAQG